MAAAVVVPSAIVVEVLSQNNYDEWSVRVKTYLMAEDLWDVVEATTEPPKAEDVGEAEFKVWKKKNAKALHAIQISCGTEVFSFIATIRSAKMAWNTLEKKLKSTYFIPEITAHANHDAKEEELVRNNDTEIEAINDDSDFERYKPFFDHIEDGDWEAAKEFLTRHPNALTVRRPPPTRGTALHVAVITKHVDIVKEVVGLMTEEDLEIKDADGDTAFNCAIYTGITQMVQCMVEKNKKLLGIRIRSGARNIIPVLWAYYWGEWEMFRYLYCVTPLEYLNGTDGAELITRCFLNKHFDLARDLIERFPNLTTTVNYDGQSPFYKLADMHSAFLSGSRLKFYERWIYNYYFHEKTNERCMWWVPSINDISIDVPKSEHDQDDNQRDIIYSGIFNRIYEMKSTHIRVLELIDLMCEVANFENDMISPAIFQAVKRGHVEFITHICKAQPAVSFIRDTKGNSIFDCAVENRQEKVYSLIYGLSDKEKNAALSSIDHLNNTLLHRAANLSPATAVQGAALQMQRELQWFKEVESFVHAIAYERKIFIDVMAARELFTKNHKELVKEGEKSMKEISTSCTVVGALIFTIMFAVAFTVPGGNNGNTGVPIFLDQKVFILFIVSDAVSLFSSTTSIMIFLGILTSRYAEVDFLKSLPTKMILGLFTLFFSIATMMIAFSSALFIMLHEKLWIVIPVILLASVPVTSFIWLQFPFLVEIFISTYGSGIFDKKVKCWY